MKNEPKTHFALILSEKSKISKYEIKNIKTKTGLSPIFFALKNKDISHARFLSRIFDSKLIKPTNYKDFEEKISLCAFSVCERRWGARFSVNCEIPTYISIGDKECRDYIGEAIAEGKGEFIIPFSKANLMP